MAQRATSLGPKPSFFCFCFLLFFVFFGGFKGQVRWPKGPPHLALNPPYFLFVFFGFWFFFFAFLSSFFNRQKTCFSPRKGHFCLFSMFLFLSPLTFFGLPPFLFLFLCLSLSLVFLSSFLSFFLLSFCFLFLSLFQFSFFFAFVSWKEQHEYFQLQFLFSWNIFSFFWFPVLLFLSNPVFLSLLFPDFKLCFLFNINVFRFKKTKLRNTNFWSKGELQQNGFFYEPVFWKMWKVIAFFCPFLPNFGWCSKNTIK